MKRNGFTLIELLAVILIIAMLGGIGIISYRTVFSSAEERYYNSVENSILLAGNDYFEDHRDELPVGDEYRMVLLSTLIDTKYIDSITDTKGLHCSEGGVYAYRENNKFKYEVCLKNCGGYSSHGKYCTTSESREINVSAKKAGSGATYIVTKTYRETDYSRGENINVTLSMDDKFNVDRYQAKNISSGEAVNCDTNGDSTCSVVLTKSGTYKVVAYGKNNKEIASRYINVRIASGESDFDLSGETKYTITKTECNNGVNKKKVTLNVVKDANIEYEAIQYRINNQGEYKDSKGLVIEEELESGHYTFDVIATSYSGDESVQSVDVDVSYLVDIEYDDDHSTTTHEVVYGKNFDFLNILPRTKIAYGHEIGVKWYRNNVELDPTNIIEDKCSFKIIGKTAMEVEISNFSDYCKKDIGLDGIKYNSTEQILTEGTLANVEFLNNKGTNAGTYTVKAHIDYPEYIWSDGTGADKNFECKILKSDNEMSVTDNQEWATGYSSSAQTTTIAGVTNANGAVTYSLKTQPEGNYFSLNGTTLTMKGSTPSGSYPLVINAHANGDGNHNSIDKEISVTVSVGMTPNTMEVVESQIWNPKYSTSSQTKSITAATNAIGAVTYSLKTQPEGNYFSLSGTTLTMKASTPAGSYTLKILVEAAGNTNYAIGSKTITMNVTVGRATNNVTITSKTYDYDGDGHNATASATSGTPTLTYYSNSNCSTQTTTANATAAGGTPKNAGTYYAIATVVASDNYAAGTSACSLAVTINKVNSSITCKNNTYSGSAQKMYSASDGCTPSKNASVTNAGSYTVSCTGDENHNDSSCSATMNPKTIKPSCSNLTWTGSKQTGCTCSIGTISGHEGTDATTYTAKCTNSGNYATGSTDWKIVGANAATYLKTKASKTGPDETSKIFTGPTPNNYVWFNCKENTNNGSSNCQKWRVIGVYDSKYVKIIYATINDKLHTKWHNSTKAAWSSSIIKNFLNGDYYTGKNTMGLKNDAVRSMIYEYPSWPIGAYNPDNKISTAYASNTSAKWKGNVGTISAYEYFYAGTKPCTTAKGIGYGSCSADNWIKAGMVAQSGSTDTAPDIWTINKAEGSSSTSVVAIYPKGHANTLSGSPGGGVHVFPSVYLKNNVLVIGGAGTDKNPWILSQ